MVKSWDHTVGFVPDPDNLTALDEYWIGYFRADGCISNVNQSTRFAQTLPEPVFEFAKYLRLPECRISHYLTKNKLPVTREMKSSEVYVISSVATGRVYSKMGVKGTLVDRRIYGSRHFWRGLIDGDGCIHLRRQSKIAVLCLMATREDCEAFLDFCELLTDSRPGIREWGKISSVQFCSNRALFILKTLYQGEYSANSKKRLLAEEAVSWGYSGRVRKYDLDEPTRLWGAK